MLSDECQLVARDNPGCDLCYGGACPAWPKQIDEDCEGCYRCHSPTFDFPRQEERFRWAEGDREQCVGDVLVCSAGAPGIGSTRYEITRIDGAGRIYGIELSSDIREMPPWAMY